MVLALFFFIITRALYIGSMVKNRFYSLIAIGLAAMLTFHVFVNIGMTIGVMPVTGLPLPFLSSGGSSLLANLVAIGLLLYAGVGVATVLLGGAFLDYRVLDAHDATQGLHLGILLVEFGVGLAVAGAMLVIFYAFAGRRSD